MPTDTDPYKVKCDASNFRYGAVLSQKQDNQWRLINTISHQLDDTERNYQTWDKEMLAVIRALEKWRANLISGKFEIYTDHYNLQFYKDPQKLT